MPDAVLAHRAFIGLGSNLDLPRKRVSSAIEALASLPLCRLVKASPLYASRPVGPQDQDDFVNAVVELRTAYSPLALLDQLQRLEQSQRRVRLHRWGPRTLDLDLLLFDDRVIEHPRLCVPHPEMLNRAFVWVPLLDISPGLRLPDDRVLSDLVDDSLRGSLVELTP
ncbi:2-amino-4-hydroxy-6-hydroxymethyldihydropteridine diphosphokinase [Halotalea alkalilenta]|uniref:2-amino-4-hydroxy-6-hydroxymethyldihydropteridine pyrophosphokinase n=1 Tax=Halotalea alkalilenta TaxID=376489 RepID=A0A172Y9Z7_9GAMM|nr:2-amino-4-hydroxy-6-hydroxymethyldihydropteridine diphosphokinase [Halotalea alkalilenta]ANF56063.1 2-amino-4-hydroxy-6-hydroxymethyldihydropteridine pyrophosphokinase [Halotalea alkalilenta]